NETLARALGVKPGDDVLLSSETPSDIPREALMGHKDPESVLATRRFTLARVLPDRGPGGFGLAFGQATPPNAFVPLHDLQRALVTRVYSDLATGLRAHGRLIPYSMVAAIDSMPIEENEIVLGSWAAEDLGVGPGDEVEMSWLVGEAGPRLRTASTALRVARVVPQEGLAADRTLTPALPGIDDAAD